MSEIEVVSLDTLAGGAAVERFNYELQKALDNIGDVNTRAETTRSVSLTIKIKPNEERSGASVSIEIKSSLAHIKPESTFFHSLPDIGEIARPDKSSSALSQAILVISQAQDGNFSARTF